MTRTPNLPSEIARPLARVRRALYVWAISEGLARLLIGAAIIFWLTLGLDYTVELSPLPRRVLLVAIYGTLLTLFVRYVLWRQFASIRDASIALVIERRRPELADRLMTAVELADRPGPFSAALIDRTAQEAGRQLANLSLDGILDRRRVVIQWLVAIALFLAIGSITWIRPKVAHIWFHRVICLKDVRYPHDTHLTVVGFDGRVKKVARGRDFELHVSADPAGVVPQRTTVRFRPTSSWFFDVRGRGRDYLTKVGAHQFKYTFPGVLEPLAFEIRGGDDYTPVFELQTVEPPRIVRATIDAEFPAYSRLASKKIEAVGAAVSLPKGTKVRLQLACGKPVEWLRCKTSSGPAAARTESELATTRIDDQTFAAEWTLAETVAIETTLSDRDGIELSEPFPIDLTAVEDQPPLVVAALDGVGSAVTPVARLPLRVQIDDDYGIEKAEFAYTIEPPDPAKPATPGADPKSAPAKPTADKSKSPPLKEVRQAAEIAASDRRRFDGTMVFEVTSLVQKPGARFSLAVAAVDGNALSGTQEGRSELFKFEIVSPEELLTRLAARELALRQRFEQILREMEDARGGLTRVRQQLADATPEGKAGRRLQAERAMHGLRKNSNETAEVASGFRGILAEMSNNRVGNTSMLDRLEQGIALPLERAIVSGFPEADAMLNELREAIEQKPDEVGDRLARSEKAVDDLIRRFQAVLAAMMKMENFNEVVAMLRAIIADQEGATEKAKQLRKKKILDLLK